MKDLGYPQTLKFVMILKKTETDEFDRGISVFKIGCCEFNNSMDKKLEKFKTFFDEYQRILKEANLIDYDDMLISSVKLLEDNADIREYYQKICEYIIEELFSTLHKRCMDTR